MNRRGRYKAVLIIMACAIVAYYVVSVFTAFTEPYFIVFLAGILVVMVMVEK